jgi:hypothetical protein
MRQSKSYPDERSEMENQGLGASGGMGGGGPGEQWSDGVEPIRLTGPLIRDMPSHRYTPAERLAAAVAWSVSGNIREVERQTGVDAGAVAHWVRDSPDWWLALVERACSLHSRELDAKLSGLVNASIEAALDRVKNGDTVVYQGELIRKPISAKDAAVVMAIAYDKRALGRGQATSRTERVDLTALRSQFARVIEGERSGDITEGANANPHTNGDSRT